jgi:hypothetical protein
MQDSYRTYQVIARNYVEYFELPIKGDEILHPYLKEVNSILKNIGNLN